MVTGIVGPDHDGQVLLVSDVAAPGLEPSEPPSLDDIPNNHFAYAVQWFIFARARGGDLRHRACRRKTP